MKRLRMFLLAMASLLSWCMVAEHARKKIGLCIVATGKYIQFVQPLIESADRYFCVDHEVIYFVFTDGEAPNRPDTVKIFQKRLVWPYATLMRCKMYTLSADLFEGMDYMYACDADMRFDNVVGDEILHERVATLHPGYVGTRGTYETDLCSRAFIAGHEGDVYFAGGFYGGATAEFIRMNRTMYANIKKDLANNYVAIWHDESHLNRYFVDNPPTLILSPSYCYSEGKRIPYVPRLVALNKDHAAMRS